MEHHHIIVLLRNISSLKELKQTHAFVTKVGLLRHALLLNKLVILAALPRWGSLEYALSVFASAPAQNHVLFNTMIKAYSRSMFPAEAVHLYNQMCLKNVTSDRLTYPFVLKALGRVCLIEGCQRWELSLARKGAEVHGRIWRSGLNCDLFVENSLIFMYSQLGRIVDARQVFDQMKQRNIVSWNTMIAAYERCNDLSSADSLLQVVPERDVTSWNMVIMRHVRLGDIRGARRIFEEMPERDTISWNSMITGYSQVKDYAGALELFNQMQSQSVEPTEMTVVSVLHACAEIGALETGRRIHSYMKRNGFKVEGIMGNALLDMYAKCGNLKLARQVFRDIGMKHVSHWNSMIVALAVHGHSEEALELFSSMEKTSSGAAKPNRITFLGVLLACSHKGLVEEGRSFFRKMVRQYNIEPDIKHYGCMVDLLSRRGMLVEAYEFIKTMPFKANGVLWKMLLAACRCRGNVQMAEAAFRELCQIEDPVDGHFVLLSNVYAGAQKWEDVGQLRSEMMRWAISKQPGWTGGLGTVGTPNPGDPLRSGLDPHLIRLDPMRSSARRGARDNWRGKGGGLHGETGAEREEGGRT
ncbi:hypothetical protein Taro_017758 [Colocasia esculenta]|uniref:Pentatricopeptide repeat-containing protein n=1 Tax=Colocasia esculenta TaxID=4460 RepID=A0A843UGZ7_COLES|nr:hypothetical protein [Colocasia esculenta]